MNTESVSQVVTTDSWTLTVPADITADSPIICIPTVHPRGDRRIIRCAQVALNAGFRVAFVWLGEGSPSTHPAIQEQLLPVPANTKARLLAVRAVGRRARSVDAILWHIHDFYMLGQARRWNWKSRRPVVYDVHEYYGEYYAEKLPIPDAMRKRTTAYLDAYQARVTAKIGGANLVAAEMGEAYNRIGAPYTVSPNFPSSEQFDLEVTPFGERSKNVIHTGSLTHLYGAELLVQLAARANERGLNFSFAGVARFPDSVAAAEFARILAAYGNPANLSLLPPVPAHEVPHLLQNYGFGLSLLLPTYPQVDLAVPSKVYEYAAMGLVTVTTQGASARFAGERSVSIVLDPQNLDGALDAMVEVAASATVAAETTNRAIEARRTTTWEGTCAPGLTGLYSKLLKDDRFNGSR